ncbi:sulfur oxidation c-type cytochrome SoxX [Kaarinaea lacus]
MSPATVSAAEMSAAEQGMKVATDRKKGNCMACHKIAGLKGRAAESHGNVGPALINMKARYPDKNKLRAYINDPQAINPNTIMPPFGKHGILSKDELDAVVEFVYTL